VFEILVDEHGLVWISESIDLFEEGVTATAQLQLQLIVIRFGQAI